MNCNSVEGITDYLGSLQGLNNLVRDRQYAHQTHKKLDEFIVLGKWYLKDDGDICLFTTANTANHEIPKVISTEEYIKIYSVETLCLKKYRMPPHFVHCSKCLEKFNLGNAHITYEYGDYDFINLNEYAGKTLFDVKKMIEKIDDSECFLAGKSAICRITNVEEVIKKFAENLGVIKRNFDFTHNTASNSEIIESCAKNIPTYQNTDVVIGEYTYTIRAGDFASIFRRRYYHEACYRKVNNEKMRRKYMEIFAKAGFGKIESKAVPNGRCSEACCADWYQFETEIGQILLYKQENVYTINYSAVGNILSCYELESTKKTDEYIQAYGEEQAVEFLERIRKFEKIV